MHRLPFGRPVSNENRRLCSSRTFQPAYPGVTLAALLIHALLGLHFSIYAARFKKKTVEIQYST
jgi:hypothetical protein